MATLATSLQEALVDFLAPLAEGADNERALTEWLATLGQTEAVAQDPALVEIADNAVALTASLSAFTEQQLASWDGLAALVEQGRQAGTLLADLRAFAANPAHSDVASGLAEEMMALLLASFLRRRHPILFRIACVLTVVEPSETATPDAPIVDGTTTQRYSRVLDRFRFDALDDLLSRPGETLASSYVPNGMTDGVDAWLGGERLFSALSFVADVVGLPWHVEHRPLVPAAPSTTAEPDEALPGDGPVNIVDAPAPEPIAPPPDSFFAAYYPTFRLTLARAAEGDIAIELAASSLQHPGGVAGFIATPVGELSLTETRDQWKLTLAATGAVPAVVVGRDGAALAPTGHPLTAGSARLTVERVAPPGEPAFVFGNAAGSRVEIGNQRFSIALTFDTSEVDLEIVVEASSGALVLAAADTDALLRQLLPEGGMRAPFDLGLVYSSTRGLSFKGGAGLDASVPAKVSVGPVTIDAIRLSLLAAPDGVTAQVACAVGLDFGPVHLIVDGVGVQAALWFPAEGGNFGLASVDVDLPPPTGIGLAVDAKVVSGGGLLRFDPLTRRFAGDVELSVADRWTLNGIGIVAPTAGGATSVLALATIELPAESPGFNVRGIGAFVGTHRRGDRDAFARGLATGDVAAILFPQDPVAQAPMIVGALDRLFPLSESSHLLGVLLELTFGGRSRIIEAQLGLIAEMGPHGDFSHVYLLIVGRLGLRGELARFLSIEVDGFGDWDIGAGEFELRLALRDSKLLGGDLTGEGLVLYYRVPGADSQSGGLVDTRPGKRQVFVSLGGYHPDYHPVARAVVGKRLSLVVTRGDWFRLEVAQYLAVTPGAYHFGVDAQLRVSFPGFGLHGGIGFDALIGFDWSFDIGFHASLTLEIAGEALAGASVDAHLIGPGPTILKGTASVSVLWWDISKSFNNEIGSGSGTVAELVDVAALLRAAVTQPESWLRQPVEGVALVERPRAERIWASPGEPLRMQQSVAPLGMPIDRFGPVRLASSLVVDVDQVTAGNAPPPPRIQGPFASALFFELDDAAKLAAVGFEDYPAGFEIGRDLVAIGNDAKSTGEYDEIVIDSTRPPLPGRRSLFGDHLWTLAGQVALVPPVEPAAPPLVTIGPRAFAVVDADGVALPGLARLTFAAAQATVGAGEPVRADEART